MARTNSSWYLCELALQGAIEVDNYSSGRNHDFSSVQELGELFGGYRLDTDKEYTLDFQYMLARRVILKNSDKEIRWRGELALELSLLRSELRDFPNGSLTPVETRDLLLDFSREFLAKASKRRVSRLIA